MVYKIIDPNNVFGQRVLILCANLVAMFSIAGFIAGLKSYTYQSFYRYGGWWSCFFGVITGMVFMFKSTNIATNKLYIGCVITIILTFASCIIDGIGYSMLIALHACTDGNLHSVGNSDYFLASSSCQVKYSCDCACVSHTIYVNPTCFQFSGAGISDPNASCEPILDGYPARVKLAFALDICVLICTCVLTLVLSRITIPFEDEDTGRRGFSISKL